MINVSSMLPKQMQTSSAASVARPQTDLKTKTSSTTYVSPNGEEYIFVKKQATKGAELVGSTMEVSKGLPKDGAKDLQKIKSLLRAPKGRVQAVERALLSTLLGGSADQKDDPQALSLQIRDELLALKSAGRHEGSLADWKHNYRTINATTISTTEAPYSLAAIAGGTTVSTRTGATISLRKLRIKFKHERTLNGTPTNQTRQPSLFVVIFRDKIPTTPGSIPVIHGTDSLPPSSGTLIFSQLGQATADAVSMMVRNPITEDAYHIYDVKRLSMKMPAYGAFSAGTLGQPAPQVEVHHWDIDLNEVQQKYSSYAATDPDINNICLVVFSDQALTGMGFTEQFSFVSDVEFHDVQDAV